MSYAKPPLDPHSRVRSRSPGSTHAKRRAPAADARLARWGARRAGACAGLRGSGEPRLAPRLSTAASQARFDHYARRTLLAQRGQRDRHPPPPLDRACKEHIAYGAYWSVPKREGRSAHGGPRRAAASRCAPFSQSVSSTIFAKKSAWQAMKGGVNKEYYYHLSMRVPPYKSACSSVFFWLLGGGRSVSACTCERGGRGVNAGGGPRGRMEGGERTAPRDEERRRGGRGGAASWRHGVLCVAAPRRACAARRSRRCRRSAASPSPATRAWASWAPCTWRRRAPRSSRRSPERTHAQITTGDGGCCGRGGRGRLDP